MIVRVVINNKGGTMFQLLTDSNSLLWDEGSGDTLVLNI